MSVALLGVEEARQEVRAKARSRRWWIFLPQDERGHGWVSALEETFYSGRKSAGFEAMLGPYGAISFGLKRYALPRQMAAFLHQAVSALQQHDVIALGAEGADFTGARVFFEWVRDRPGEEMVGGVLGVN